MPVPILATLQAIGASSAATGGGAVGAGSAIGGAGGGIFGQFSNLLNDKLPGIDKAQKSITGSLNKAANINISPASFTPPQIDPGLVGSIDRSTFDFAKLADSIIEQSGLKDLMGELDVAKTTETKKTTSTKKTDSGTTPTQGTNKPVEKADQSREENRTNLEQLFLDLINGKLNIKL